MRPTVNGRHTPPRQRPHPRPQEDPYRIGWREVPRASPDGAVEYDRIPLTAEDALHPQPGDVMPQGTAHDADSDYLCDSFRQQVADDPHALVAHDLLIDWDIPGMRAHSPDAVVIFEVDDPAAERSSFDVAREGVRPRVIAEVVSPAYRDNDVVTKAAHYHRCRVPWFLLVDRQREGDPPAVRAYRYTRARYVPVRPDRQGRVKVPPLNLLVGVRGRRVVCFDSRTGEELVRAGEVARRIKQAQQATAQAERQAAQQARKTRKAERIALDEKRRAADAEARVQQLEEELRRLRGGSP